MRFAEEFVEELFAFNASAWYTVKIVVHRDLLAWDVRDRMME